MDVYIQSKDCRKDDVAALQKLLASGRAYSELDLAYLLRINAGFNHVDCARLLLDQKADASLSACSLHADVHGQKSPTGRDSLHEAFLWGANAEVVSLLLQYCANVDLQAKQKGKETIAHGVAIATGHHKNAASLATVNCPS